MTLRLFGLFLCTGLCAVSSSGKETLLPLERLEKGQASASPAKTYILAVGVSEYQDAYWPTLRWAHRDANKVEKNFGTGLSRPKTVITLQNENATKLKVLAALQKMESVVREQDEVIVYFSGHGTLGLTRERDVQKIMVLHDTNHAKLRETGLSHRDIYRRLARIGAKKKLLVLATCHSGVGKSKMTTVVQKLLSSLKGGLAPLESVSEGFVVLSASTKSETAREDNRLQGDIYTHFLLEGLDVYDRNKDGAVSALEAHDYATRKTYNYTKGQQRPTAVVSAIGEGTVTLRGARHRSPLPVLVGYSPGFLGTKAVVNGKDKGALPSAFVLKAGENQVQLLDSASGNTATYDFSVQPGERVDLEDILRPAPFRWFLGSSLSVWNSPAMESLAGGGTDLHYLIGLRRVYDFWQVGLNIEMSTTGGEAVRPGLEASVLLTRESLSVGAKLLEKLSLHVQLGVEQAVISFTDVQSSKSLSFASNGFFYGARLEWIFWSLAGAQIFIHANQTWSHHEFSQIGELSTAHTGVFGIGLHFDFGGKARRQ